MSQTLISAKNARDAQDSISAGSFEGQIAAVAHGGINTFADLFCGIGGFHYAAASFGLRCVFACDIDEEASRQYEWNFGVVPEGDITQINSEDIPEHDILFAGFPCQPFSIIGNRGGMRDSRGTLVYEIVRILEAKQPRAFVLENVRQLTTLGGGRTMKAILSALAEAGYECDWRILNALDYGLPQKRERVIFVGFRDRSLDLFKWPETGGAYKPLAEILETDPDSRHFVSDRVRTRRRLKHQSEVVPSIWHENKGGNISSHPFSCALRAGASYNYLLVNGERRLTPREQLRLQGFPEEFEVIGNDSQIRKQTGNAVPVPMVQAVIKEVLNAVSQNTKRIRKARAVSA